MLTLIETAEETATVATQCGDRVKAAEQVVVDLEQKHAALLAELSTNTARIVAGDDSGVDLTDLAAQAGEIARALVEARNSLAESERQYSAAVLTAHKANFLKTAVEAKDVRTRFHASYRESCLAFGELMKAISKLTVLANSCRMPSFGLLADQKNTLADFNSEDSLNPLKALLDEFEVTREITMDKLTAINSVQCLPLVPKIVPKKDKR
jgi:hypothetical protein